MRRQRWRYLPILHLCEPLLPFSSSTVDLKFVLPLLRFCRKAQLILHSWSYIFVHPILPLSRKAQLTRWLLVWMIWTRGNLQNRLLQMSFFHNLDQCIWGADKQSPWRRELWRWEDQTSLRCELRFWMSFDSERVGFVKEFVADTSFLFCDWLEFFFDDPTVNGFVQFFLLSMYDWYSYSYYEQVIRHGEEGKPEDRKAEVKVSPSYISVTLFAFL